MYTSLTKLNEALTEFHRKWSSGLLTDQEFELRCAQEASQWALKLITNPKGKQFRVFTLPYSF